MRKAVKFFLINLIVFTAVSFCYGQADIFSAIRSYIDPIFFEPYQKAVDAMNESPDGWMPEQAFRVEYENQHPEFVRAEEDAIQKAMRAKGTTDPEDLTPDSLKNLTKQIDANNKLSEEQKEYYKNQLQRYHEICEEMVGQLGGAQDIGNTFETQDVGNIIGMGHGSNSPQ